MHEDKQMLRWILIETEYKDDLSDNILRNGTSNRIFTSNYNRLKILLFLKFDNDEVCQVV